MSDSFHAHKYDLTSKSLFKDLELPLLEYVTGQSVQFQRYLDIQFQTISSQRADLVCEALLGQQEVVIHLEIQADNDPNMLYRMLSYLVDIHHQYQKPIYQCVVYLGAKTLNMAHQLCFELAESNKLDYHYQMLTLNQVSFDETIPNLRHEDTLFSYHLKQHEIPIQHIDNPIYHLGLDSFEKAMQKEHESLFALKNLLDQNLIPLDYLKISRILHTLQKAHLITLVAFFHNITRFFLIRNLASAHPSLFIFDIYRLSYLCKLYRNN